MLNFKQSKKNKTLQLHLHWPMLHRCQSSSQQK